MSQSLQDWVDFNQKNKPQGNALAAGFMVLLVSGIQVGWIINSELMHFPWARGHSSLQVILTYVSFYIGAGIGLYMASIIIDRLTKKNIYVSGAIKERNCGFIVISIFSSLL